MTAKSLLTGEGKLTTSYPTQSMRSELSTKAHAFGKRLLATSRSRHDRPTVVIGSITSNFKTTCETALQDGFSNAGVDSVLCGQLPIPAIFYLTHANKYRAFAVINRAQEPDVEDDVDFFSAEGVYQNDKAQPQLEPLKLCGGRPELSGAVGYASRMSTAARQYIEFCKNGCVKKPGFTGLKVVIDASLGAARDVAPKVFHELGAQVIALGLNAHGLNENGWTGPTVLQQLAWAVRALQADVGIGINREGTALQVINSVGKVHYKSHLRNRYHTENSGCGTDDAIVTAVQVLARMQDVR